MKSHNLKPITKETIIYARPEGGHYHLDRHCPMLIGRQFESYGYVEIKEADIKERRLYPCVCAFESYSGNKLARIRK